MDYGNKKLEYAIENILKSGLKDITLFITDTGLNDSQISFFEKLIKNVNEHGGKVFWFDHHYWKPDQIGRIAKLCDLAIVGENEYACAAEITRAELGLEDDFSVKLANMAHETDFEPILHPYIRNARNPIEIYGLAFSYYNNIEPLDKQTTALRAIVGMLSSGKFLDENIVSHAKEFERKTRMELSKIEKQIYNINKDFAIGFAQSLNSNIACDKIRSVTKSDIVLYIDITHDKGHFRSSKTDIVNLAISFGGGGHPHSAGFDINKKKFKSFKTNTDRLRFIGVVSKNAKKILS